MADSSKDIQLRELKDMINDLKKMIKTLQATVDAANKREAETVWRGDHESYYGKLGNPKFRSIFSSYV